jgi:hypothetical protein
MVFTASLEARDCAESDVDTVTINYSCEGTAN